MLPAVEPEFQLRSVIGGPELLPAGVLGSPVIGAADQDERAVHSVGEHRTPQGAIQVDSGGDAPIIVHDLGRDRAPE